MYCIKCGKQIEGDEKYCEDCRKEMLLYGQEENQSANEYAEPVIKNMSASAVQPDNGPWKVFAIVGFALGIFSLCMSWFVYFSLLTGSTGLVFSILGAKSIRNGGKARAGIVMNAVAMAISFIATIVFFRVIIAGVGRYY